MNDLENYDTQPQMREDFSRWLSLQSRRYDNPLYTQE